MLREYSTVREISGPLIWVEGVSGAKLGERVEIAQDQGEVCAGRVLELDGDRALVQLLGSSQGLKIESAKARFLGRPIRLSASMDMMGRTFDGLGHPRDGGPEVIPEFRLDIDGAPINPAARERPGEFIQTGISAIDGLNTLARGQKMAICSGPGLPHAQLAAQIARQANMTVVFGGIGIPFEEADLYTRELRRTGAIENSVLFLNLASDPVLERIAVPRMALTAAEYLAFERGMHVLVILSDMTSYADALFEVSAARKEAAALHADLARLFERAGRIRGKPGSLTLMPILTMPDGDMAHVVPDIVGSITEGQIVLSRELHQRGVQPPIDVLRSQSHLMHRCIGEGKTRADHAPCMNQLLNAHSRSDFADAFVAQYLSQGYDADRSLDETIDLGWKLLSMPEMTNEEGANGAMGRL